MLEFPGYAPPEWSADEESPGGRSSRRACRRGLCGPPSTCDLGGGGDGPGGAAAARCSSTTGRSTPGTRSSCGCFDHLVAFGEVPPFRAALVPPPLDRNEMYSASHRYARVLGEDWVPHSRELAPSPGPPVAIGASLGALSLLHAQWYEAGPLQRSVPPVGQLLPAALRRARVGRAALRPHHALRLDRRRRPADADPIPVTITCGTGEENLDNNLLHGRDARSPGWDVRVVQHPDAHNWISWRDVLHPHLAELLLRAG